MTEPMSAHLQPGPELDSHAKQRGFFVGMQIPHAYCLSMRNGYRCRRGELWASGHVLRER